MYKPKDLHFGKVAMDKVFEGADKVYNAVSSTLGVYAHTVVIELPVQKELAPTVTKDGVTVARSIDLADPLEQLGAKLILQASKQADDKSGDGTTTTIVLGRHATVAAMKMRESGMLTVHVRERLKEMREWLEAELIRITAGFKVTADTVRQVALVSGNGDTTIADIAMKAYEAARGGRIDVYKSRGEDDILTIREGCVVSGRALTVDALARGRAATFFGKPAVAIVNGYVESTTLDIINAQSPECAVIVFAHHLRDGLEEKVTSINQRRDRNSPIVIAPCPGVGTVRQVYIDAMVAMFGCPVYEHGYETMEFGSVDAVEFDDDYVIINPNKDIFDEEAVATTIRNMRNNFPIGTTRYVQHDEILRFVLGRRVFITVGGCTESEIGERHDRMVDAVRAMGLVEQGIIPGGGTVLAKMSTRLPEHLRMFEPVLIAPMAKILENGGVENSEVLVRELASTTGNGRDWCDFHELIRGENIDLAKGDFPVYDPVRVTINAARGAFSVATNIVTTNCYIVEHSNRA